MENQCFVQVQKIPKHEFIPHKVIYQEQLWYVQMVLSTFETQVQFWHLGEEEAEIKTRVYL